MALCTLNTAYASCKCVRSCCSQVILGEKAHGKPSEKYQKWHVVFVEHYTEHTLGVYNTVQKALPVEENVYVYG